MAAPADAIADGAFGSVWPSTLPCPVLRRRRAGSTAADARHSVVGTGDLVRSRNRFLSSGRDW
jgi:hypothetical protein